MTIIWPPSQSIRYYVPEDLHLAALPLVGAWICIVAGTDGFSLAAQPRNSIRSHVFVSFYLPVSGIIPFPSAPLADRYLYLPAIGLWLVAADQVGRLLYVGEKERRYGMVAAGIVLLMLAASTAARNLDWKNDVMLFSRFVMQYPDNAFGHHNLGCAYLDEAGDLHAAEREFNKALAYDPYFPRLRTQLGYIQLKRGDYKGRSSITMKQSA